MKPTKILINIDVSDIDLAINFYKNAFDLSVGIRLDKDCVELIGSGYSIYLLEKAANKPFSTATTVRDFHRHWTPIHLDFVVTEIEAALHKALSAGAQLEERRKASWGYLAQLSDPFGNGFCLLQFVGKGYQDMDAIGNKDQIGD